MIRSSVWTMLIFSRGPSHRTANPIRPDEKSIFRSRIEETYNWEKIAVQTIKVYEKALVK